MEIPHVSNYNYQTALWAFLLYYKYKQHSCSNISSVTIFYIFVILSWSFPVCPHLLKSVVTESSHNIPIRSSWMHNITERLLPNVPWIIPFNKFQNHNGLGSASRLQVFLLYFCLVGSFITNKCYLTLETNICVNVTLILLLTFQKSGKISKC